MEKFNPQPEAPELSLDESAFNNIESLLGEINEKAVESGKGFKKLVPKILKKALYGLATYVVLANGAEVGKRLYANGEYEKTKNMLTEYQVENDTSTYEEKYNAAAKLFNEDNLFWAKSPKDFNAKIKKNTENLKEIIAMDREGQWSLAEVITVGSLTPVVAPSYLFKNAYVETYKDDQEAIENMSNEEKKGYFDGTDTTVMNPKNPDIILENERMINGGFQEQFDTLKKEEFVKIINETYPQGWFSREISSIEMTSDTAGQHDIDVDQYGKDVLNLGEAAHFTRLDRKILFRNYTLTNPVFTFEVIAHESAHGNDWLSNEDLTQIDRMNLLLKVADRLDDKDRFMSSYVEKNINPENIQDKTYTKAVEYFAEICGEYFTHGKENLAPKDVEIVELVINVKDKNFNIDNALLRRGNIIQAEVYKKPIFDIRESMKLHAESNKLGDQESAAYEEYTHFVDQNHEQLDSLARKYGYRDRYWLIDFTKDKHFDEAIIKKVLDLKAKVFEIASEQSKIYDEIRKIKGKETSTAWDVDLDKTGIYTY